MGEFNPDASTNSRTELHNREPKIQTEGSGDALSGGTERFYTQGSGEKNTDIKTKIDEIRHDLKGGKKVAHKVIDRFGAIGGETALVENPVVKAIFRDSGDARSLAGILTRPNSRPPEHVFIEETDEEPTHTDIFDYSRRIIPSRPGISKGAVENPEPKSFFGSFAQKLSDFFKEG